MALLELEVLTQVYLSYHRVGSQLLGDINLDGSVDISDAQLLFQYSMMPDFYPIGYTGNVDFNGDGNVDIADAQRLFQYSMMPDFYPIG